MKNMVSITLAALLIFGCAGAKKVQEVRNNSRIVYRDLTKPKQVSYPVPEMPAGGQPEPKNIGSIAQTEDYQPIRFIEFANDSYNAFDKDSLTAFTAATPGDALVLVVGHSHGHSAVGTLRLASKRAETVAGQLKGRGYNNVHVMAAWGPKSVPFAPSRGVHLYVLDSDGQSETVPIVFAKTVKEKNNGRPELYDEMASTRPAESRLGDV